MSNAIKNRIKQFLNLNILKTVYVNFRMLPVRQAVKFPIWINYRTELVNLSGKITIKCPIKLGMIKFSDNGDGFVGKHHWHRIEIIGEVVFEGKIEFGVGMVLSVNKAGRIVFKDNIFFAGKTYVLCEESVIIGNNVRVAHESQLMDTNFHYIRNIMDDSVEKCTTPVVIGNNNWIGNRTTIMKGTITPDYLIVGSNSLLNRDYSSEIKPYSIMGGVPAKFLKSGYERIFDYDIEHEYDRKFNRFK